MNSVYWDTESLDSLLLLYVGKTHGENPSQCIDKIRAAKQSEAANIVSMLPLGSNDIVVDLGSGCGFIAKEIAPLVNTLHCVDVSKSFLDYCKVELSGLSNVRYHHIEYSNLTQLPVNEITKIYALALFIHFNLYDIYHYLKSIYMILSPGGKLLFDFLDDKTLNIEDDVWIRHSARYLADQSNFFTNIYYNNEDSVINIAKQIGFSVSMIKHTDQQCWLVLDK
jgi:cyclopropane fatty-acyl-phospholipid synthase-like methyltransferase